MMLEREFAHFTECQLATVDDLMERRLAGRFPEGELIRHLRIADSMVRVCMEHQIQPDHGYPRLYERLKTLGVSWLKEDFGARSWPS